MDDLMLFSQRPTSGDCHDAKDTILIKHNEKYDVDKIIVMMAVLARIIIKQ